MITKFISGLFKSPFDDRDWLYSSFVKPFKFLPESFDNTSKMTPVRNQGNEGSCAGFAGMGIKEYEEKLDAQKFIELSPRFIYELAKKESGHSEGTTLRAIVDVLREYGICPEEDWRYIPNKVGEPRDGAYERAKNYKIEGYARVTNLEELKTAICQVYPAGGAILIGMLLYKSILGDQSRNTGVCPDPTCWSGNPIGGHAVIACGWNDNSPYYKNDGHIKCKGSWGDDFGAKGYHYFSYKNIKKNMLDAFTMIDIQGSGRGLRICNLSKRERKGKWL